MPNTSPIPEPPEHKGASPQSKASALQHWGERVRSLPAWLRIPTFVLPFLAVWWMFDRLQLPDLAIIVGLYLLVVAAFAAWGTWIHRQSRPYRALGLAWGTVFSRELWVGWVIGMLGGFAPLMFESVVGWLVWQPVEPSVLLTAWGNAIATAVAIGFAEELLFRGWLLEELRLDYPDWLAATVTTIVFAIVHQWGLQLVGLLLVGAILVRGKYRTGNRLGLSIGLHVGWVLAISAVNIADWVRYTAVVPAWVTGMGGNPLAGCVGWLTLLVTLAGIELSNIGASVQDSGTR